MGEGKSKIVYPHPHPSPLTPHPHFSPSPSHAHPHPQDSNKDYINTVCAIDTVVTGYFSHETNTKHGKTPHYPV